MRGNKRLEVFDIAGLEQYPTRTSEATHETLASLGRVPPAVVRSLQCVFPAGPGYKVTVVDDMLLAGRKLHARWVSLKEAKESANYEK